jgi:hypothetical protein
MFVNARAINFVAVDGGVTVPIQYSKGHVRVRVMVGRDDKEPVLLMMKIAGS